LRVCGRYSHFFTWKQLHRLMRLTAPPGGEPDLLPQYNVAPTQAAPVVRQDARGVRSLDMLRWGLVPFWSKDGGGMPSPPAMNRGRGSLINARSEGAGTNRVFRGPLERRRCLVPASGFFEWQKAEEEGLFGARRVAGRPYYIHRKDGEPFAFAGLWERWSRDGETVESFTILTTRSNDLVRPLHDRMPAILRPGDFDVWLDPGVIDAARITPLLRPYEGADMEAYAVSTWVNNPAHNDHKCVQPVDPQ
jgi:putative SOS response-associated peptidase YedK